LPRRELVFLRGARARQPMAAEKLNFLSLFMKSRSQKVGFFLF